MLIVGTALLLGGCFTRPAATAGGPAFPAGCGPRRVVRPPAAAVPASPEPPGRPLPLYGAPVLHQGLAASGHTVAVSTTHPFGGAVAGPAGAAAGVLHLSTDAGRRWAPMAVPPVNGALNPLVLSTDGRWLAGGDLSRLYVRKVSAGAAGSSAWVTRPVQNLLALAFDPADPHRLAGLGGPIGTGSDAVVYLSRDDGRTLSTHPPPLPLGRGEGLAVARGAAIVALGRESGPARLFAVPFAGGTPSVLPQPPAASAPPSTG